jgi:hypothetical protein
MAEVTRVTQESMMAKIAEQQSQIDQLEQQRKGHLDDAASKRTQAGQQQDNKAGRSVRDNLNRQATASETKAAAVYEQIKNEQKDLAGLKKTLAEMQNYEKMAEQIKAKSGINFDTMDLTTLLLALFMERANNIEDAIKEQSKILQEKNLKMAESNEILQMVRAQRPAKDSDEATLPGEAIEWASRNGIDLPNGGSGKIKQAQWDQVIENIKGHTDQLSNTSQMDMIKLENLLNKRNQSFDFMSNFISKMAKVDDGIIGNIR